MKIDEATLIKDQKIIDQFIDSLSITKEFILSSDDPFNLTIELLNEDENNSQLRDTILNHRLYFEIRVREKLQGGN